MQFVQEIGRIAEALQHHPEILIRYREVTVTATTHEAGNQVTQKDEQLMAAIKQASAKYRKA